jgi:hypothetical protein
MARYTLLNRPWHVANVNIKECEQDHSSYPVIGRYLLLLISFFKDYFPMNIRYLVFTMSLVAATNVSADSSTLDAAIGGGIGGAVGAAIGNEVGGRDGAIIGGAVGGGVGAAVTTDENAPHQRPTPRTEYRYAPQHQPGGSRFCPPGQAKKGRC